MGRQAPGDITGGEPVLLKTTMEAGHGGASGRFERLDDVARIYAFAIACAEGRIGARAAETTTAASA